MEFPKGIIITQARQLDRGKSDCCIVSLFYWVGKSLVVFNSVSFFLFFAFVILPWLGVIKEGRLELADDDGPSEKKLSSRFIDIEQTTPYSPLR